MDFIRVCSYLFLDHHNLAWSGIVGSVFLLFSGPSITFAICLPVTAPTALLTNNRAPALNKPATTLLAVDIKKSLPCANIFLLDFSKLLTNPGTLSLFFKSIIFFLISDSRT
jgi:hypothetical protein